MFFSSCMCYTCLVILNIGDKHKFNMYGRYIRDLLLNPPVFEIASAIQGKSTIS